MLAAEHYPVCNFQKHELLEVHRSKVSIHNAKSGYRYPTIRLPHTFSTLAGLPTRIYQTVHDGALAFLVVVSAGVVSKNSDERSENVEINVKMPALTWRRSPVRIRPSPSFFLQSETRIVADELFYFVKPFCAIGIPCENGDSLCKEVPSR
jgi:hypothetical protein